MPGRPGPPMTATVASHARAGRGRSRAPSTGVRPPARPPSPPASAISATASLLAASFADQGATPEHGEAVPEQASRTGSAMVARRATGEAAPPVGWGGAPIHWITWPGAPVRGSLLDLQRLAGNAAVASALGRGPGGTGPAAGSGELARTGAGDAASVQRINIPGIGEVNVSGYLSKAASILSSAEESRDKGKADARKGADDVSGEATEHVDTGKADLEAGQAEAEGAGDTAFSETRGAAEEAAASGREEAAAETAKGDQAAERVKAVAPEVEGLVDPLAESVGLPAAARGEQAMAEAAGHAAGAGGGPETAGAGGAETAAPAGAAPAVSHGPGPPAPGPGPPAPGAAPAPAGAGPSAAAPGPAVPSAGGPIKMVGTAGPSCALAEAAKGIKGYTDKAAELAKGAIGRVAEIEIPLLGETVGSLAKKAAKAASAVGKELKAVKDAVVAKAKAVGEKIKSGIATAAKLAKKGFDAAATAVKAGIKQAKDLATKGWETAKTAVGTAITKAKEKAASAVRGAISTVQGWIRSVPDAILDLLGGVGSRLKAFANAKDPLGDAAAYLEEKKRQARARLDAAKQAAIAVAKSVADAGVRKAAELYQRAKSNANAVADLAKKAAPYVVAAVAPGVVLVAGLAQKAAETWGDDIRAGAEAVKKKIKGEACEALSETVGPCIDMYLPKPENNDKGFAKLSGQADITVPLHEVGVPCNVKMGRSASVGVERTTSGYGVSVDGEALVFANLAAGKEGTKQEVKVELPTGGMATVWEKLGGGAKPPVPSAGPAPAAQPSGGTPPPGGPTPVPPGASAGPAPAPAGGGGAEFSGEVEAGLKGSASLKFAFPTGTNTCEGAGGVAALLGALGVAAALPSPLDMIAKSGVVGSWESNLVSNTVTMGVAGGGQFELSKEGLGALKGAGQAEAYVTTGVERADEKKPDSLRPTLKVGAGLKGELAGELAVPKLGLAKGAVSGAGKLEATLVFDKPTDRIILQSVGAEAEVGLSVGGINPAVIASSMAPPFGPAAAAKLTSLGLAHSNGSIKAKVFGKADNLQKYIDAAGAYLSGDSSSVSASGLVKAVAAKYDDKDFSSGVTVTATLSDRIGVEGKIEEIAGEGAKAGASGKASLEVGKEYQLYP